jgi:hypothetical protein
VSVDATESRGQPERRGRRGSHVSERSRGRTRLGVSWGRRIAWPCSARAPRS